MYFRSLILAVFTMLAITAVQCTSEAGLTTEGEINPLLLISIDGFQNEYLERNETPNFDRFIDSGIKAEYMIPSFPTKTFPTHWTLATGLYVENHGIISNSFFDYELGERFSYGPPDDSPNDERWWGGEPIWITAEKQGKTAATFFWPGSEASINGVRPTKWVDYDGSIPNRDRIDQVAEWLDPNGDVRADFATLYFSFVDSRGHAYGPNSAEVDEAVKEMDDLLGHLFSKIEEIGMTDRLNVILTSDHGMAEMSEDKLVFLDDLINLDHVDMVDWTPVAMIRPHEGRTEEIYNALKKEEDNHGYTVYLREDVPERFGFTNHYRIPETIMIADMSYTITSRPFFEQRGIPAGNHGFDNDTPEMHTFFSASGPDFLRGETVEAFESVHLYELMSRLLGLEPAKNDGERDRLLHFLRQ